jgi:hypothetical protein
MQMNVSFLFMVLFIVSCITSVLAVNTKKKPLQQNLGLDTKAEPVLAKFSFVQNRIKHPETGSLFLKPIIMDK